MKLRLYGIDTPELRGAERPEGLKARDYLRELILDKEIYLQSIKDKQGKYGRYLAIIHLEKGEELLNVNEHLIKKEFAVERYY
jgi:micrococcal nuclease